MSENVGWIIGKLINSNYTKITLNIFKVILVYAKELNLMLKCFFLQIPN